MDAQSEILERECSKIFKDIEREFDYPDGTFSLTRNYSKKGKNIGKLTSTRININEFSYPFDENNKIAKSISVLLLKPNQRARKLVVREYNFAADEVPSSAKVTQTTQGRSISYNVHFELDDPAFFQYIRDTLFFCLRQYESSSSFVCCARFNKCSEMRKCVHPNKLYAKGCRYRRNLEHGQNFLLNA